MESRGREVRPRKREGGRGGEGTNDGVAIALLEEVGENGAEDGQGEVLEGARRSVEHLHHAHVGHSDIHLFKKNGHVKERPHRNEKVKEVVVGGGGGEGGGGGGG